MIDARIAQQIVANALAYAIFTLDFDGVITAWGPGAERVLGYAAEEAVGQSFALLFLPPDLAAQTHRAELDTAIATGTAENTRWHVRKGGERFWANGVTMRVRDAPRLIKIMRDETRAKLAEDQRVLLLNELNHRIKNTLATVQSIVDQTLRSSDVDGAIRERLTERLIALSQAHDVLIDESWASASLPELIAAATGPHGPERFSADGPPLRLSPDQAVSMSLALHELITNAVKHGALSVPEGRVRLSWNISYDAQGGRSLTFLWEEVGGPPVSSPDRVGFGTRLLARSFQPSGGRATSEFAEGGLRCLIQAPLSSPAELPDLGSLSSHHPPSSV